jgi:hypothetical protein
MAFDGPSKPLSQAPENIAQLRRLAHLTDSGILSGNVRRMYTGRMDGAPNHKVVAKRVSDGSEYSPLTDSEGEFKFDPLPAGIYEVTANTAKGFVGRERRQPGGALRQVHLDQSYAGNGRCHFRPLRVHGPEAVHSAPLGADCFCGRRPIHFSIRRCKRRFRVQRCGTWPSCGWHRNPNCDWRSKRAISCYNPGVRTRATSHHH